MAELFYTIGVEDEEGKKTVNSFTDFLKKNSRQWEEILKPIQLPTFTNNSTGGGAGGSGRVKPEIVGLKAELSNLEKQWGRLTVAQRQSEEGGKLVQQYAELKKQAGELSGTLNQLTKAQTQAAQKGGDFRKSIKDIGDQTKQTGLFARELVNTLKTFAGFYFARDAVRQLIEVSGQFELQLVSLRAITQSLEGANKLFSQFQSLSVKSPFQFSEILAGAKQLAAFQIPLKDLYQTTKVITDLSAGLGVDMGRIILAYGQIQAASVLRGQEVRQLTEAGIPVIQLLADKFSLLEDRVVSTNEVFDKISNRMVPFEMIKEIFTDLTSEGGAFFNMQEKQADTLYGKVSNLKDAYQIMLNEIGTANNELLKGAVEIPMTLMENWEKVGAALTTLIATYGVFKTVSILSSISDTIYKYGSLSKAIASTTAAQKLYNASLLVNPLVGWATALTAIGTALYFAYQNTQRLTNELSKINTEGLSGAENTVSKFDELYKKLQQAKEGSQDFRDAIKAINSQYGEYLPNLLTESNALSELAGNYDKVTQAIYNKAKAQSAEKGFAAIQEEYGKQQEDAVSRLMDSLISSGIPKDKAKDLLKLFRTELEKQTGEYNPYELFNKVYEGYFDTTKKYFSDTEQLLNSLIQSGGALSSVFGIEFVLPGVAKGAEALFDLSRATDYLTESTKNYGDILDVTWGMSTAKTAEEADRLKVINDQYEGLTKKIQGNTQSQEEWNDAVKKLEYSKLQATIRMYEELNRPEMVKELKKQLAALDDVQDGWRGVVIETLKATKAGSIYKPQKDESQFDYLDRLKKAYAEVTEQIKIMNTLSIFSPEEKDRLQQQKIALEAVSAAMGASLLTDEDANKERKIAADLIKDQTDSVKKLYADYKKFLEYMSAGDAKKKIEELYKGLIPKGVDVFDPTTITKFLSDAGNQIEKLKGKGEGLSLKLDAIEIERSAISEQIDKAIVNINAQLNQKKEQFDLFKSLFSATGDQDFALQFTMSIYGEMEIPDYQEALKKAIEEQFTDEKLGIKIESPIVIDEKGSIDYKKTQDSINKLREDGQKKAADFYQGQLDLLIKYKIDDAKEWAEILKRYSTYEDQRRNIQAKALEERKKIAKSDLPEQKKLEITSAITKKEEKDVAKLFFDEFKETDTWINAFEELDRLSKDTLNSILKELDNFKKGAGANLDPTALKEYMSVYRKIREELEQRTPFDTIKTGVKDIIKYTNELRNAEKGTKEYTDAQDNLRGAQIKTNVALGELGSRFSEISQSVSSVNDMFDSFGVNLPAEFGYIAEGIGKIGEGLSSIDVTKPFSIVTGFAKAIGGLATTIFAPFKAANERIIKNSQDQIKRLQNSYADLERAADKALGTDVYDKQKDQIKNLGDQQKELQKQLATEGKKGGLSREEADEIRRQTVELAQQQEDIIDGIRDSILGTAKDIASELGNALFDAFAAGEDYAEAWGNKVDEIVGDILKKMLIQKFLEKPIGDAIKKYQDKFIAEDDTIDFEAFQNGLAGFSGDLKNAITVGTGMLESVLDDPELAKYLKGEAVEETGKGTAQAITGVTEDTANILGGYMNGMRAEMVIQTAIFNNQTAIFTNIHNLLQQRLGGVDNPVTQMQLNIMGQQLMELQSIKTILTNTLGAAYDAANRRFRVG